MNKKQLVLVIIVTVIIVWVADLLVGNYLSARLATSEFARRFNLFNPQAPIVVTNRETVRVNSNNDIVQTAENSKSKVASVVYFENNRLVSSGGALNWTSDGYFVTTKTALSAANKVYAVMTQQGEVYPIEATYPDPASNLVILNTAAQNLPVLDPTDANDLRVGEQVVALTNSIGNRQTEATVGYVNRAYADTAEQVMESDLISQNLNIQIPALASGSAVLNLSGRLIGIWDGSKVIPASDIRSTVNNFLSNNQQIVRPSFGFSYQMLSEGEAKALQTTPGARIMGIAPGKSAAVAGLKAGDVIVEIDKQKVESGRNLDAQLRQFKPTESISMVINRQGNTQTLTLLAATLK